MPSPLVPPPWLDLAHEREHAFETYGLLRALRDELRHAPRQWAISFTLTFLLPVIIFATSNGLWLMLLGTYGYLIVVGSPIMWLIWCFIKLNARYQHVSTTRLEMVRTHLPQQFLDEQAQLVTVSRSQRALTRLQTIVKDNTPHLALALTLDLIFVGVSAFFYYGASKKIMAALFALPAALVALLIVFWPLWVIGQLVLPNARASKRLQTELVMRQLRQDHQTFEGALSVAREGSGGGELSMSGGHDLTLISSDPPTS